MGGCYVLVALRLVLKILFIKFRGAVFKRTASFLFIFLKKLV